MQFFYYTVLSCAATCSMDYFGCFS